MPPKVAEKRKLEEIKGHLGTLSFEELKSESEAVGVKAGPIDDATKDIYIRMIAVKKLKLETEESDILAPPQIPSVPSHIFSTTTGASLLAESPAITTASPGSTDSAVSSGGRGAKGKTLPKKTPHKNTKKPNPQAIRDFTIDGLTAATFTPMKDDGELNLCRIGNYVDWLLKNGVKNIFLNGTTGESLSLTIEERKTLTEKWIKVAAGRLKVIVHVGTENMKYTCQLAQHAELSGAVAMGVMPTTFIKPPSIDHLILYLQKVAEAAPNLPMYYYHIPERTGVNFTMEEFLEAAVSRLPTLRGIKYTNSDLLDFGRCIISQGSAYQIIFGRDEQLIGALAMGGTTAIGSTYNYAGKLHNRLINAYARKDTEAAKLEQRRSQAMIKLLIKYGSHAGGGKAFMKLCGIDCGPPRLPLLPLTPENMKNLESDLRDIGFFEWA